MSRKVYNFILTIAIFFMLYLIIDFVVTFEADLIESLFATGLFSIVLLLGAFIQKES